MVGSHKTVSVPAGLFAGTVLVNRVVSVDKMNDNYIGGLTDIYKESLNVKIETEDDLVMEYGEEYL